MNAIVLLESVNGADIGVIQRGQQPRLALEPAAAIGIGGKNIRQNLDRHVAPEPRIAGAVDVSHPACAEERANFIMPKAPADQR